MTDEQIKALEKHAATLEEASQRILALSMGNRPFTYDPVAIELVYRILDRGVSFERLCQVLIAHQTTRETIVVNISDELDADATDTDADSIGQHINNELAQHIMK